MSKLDPSSIVTFLRPIRRHRWDILAWGFLLASAGFVCAACAGWL